MPKAICKTSDAAARLGNVALLLAKRLNVLTHCQLLPTCQWQKSCRTESVPWLFAHVIRNSAHFFEAINGFFCVFF